MHIHAYTVSVLTRWLQEAFVLAVEGYRRDRGRRIEASKASALLLMEGRRRIGGAVDPKGQHRGQGRGQAAREGCGQAARGQGRGQAARGEAAHAPCGPPTKATPRAQWASGEEAAGRCRELSERGFAPKRGTSRGVPHEVL